jgi:hypothetical protein
VRHLRHRGGQSRHGRLRLDGRRDVHVGRLHVRAGLRGALPKPSVRPRLTGCAP